jgi:uncharacterized membrane protein YphA (DoxX/SURF4 family)
MRTLFLAGRALFGGFFIQNGISHFKNQKMLAEYAASKGVPNPEAAVAASGALLLAGGFSVLAGARPREGLVALLTFLVPVTLQMHRFWEVTEPSEAMNEKVNFMKNTALAGAAMMLMQMPTPWPASTDRLGRNEEMYLHLSSRDRLRLLA